MIYYELKIESGEETIEIKEENRIYFAEVMLDTLNNDTQKKSNALLARMTLKGTIDPSINDSLIKISAWARDLKNDTTYRKVTLTIKDDAAGAPLREYEIPDMFVCDYHEIYGDSKEDKNAIFKLKLTQKENQLKNFKTY